MPFQHAPRFFEADYNSVSPVHSETDEGIVPITTEEVFAQSQAMGTGNDGGLVAPFYGVDAECGQELERSFFQEKSELPGNVSTWLSYFVEKYTGRIRSSKILSAISFPQNLNCYVDNCRRSLIKLRLKKE